MDASKQATFSVRNPSIAFSRVCAIALAALGAVGCARPDTTPAVFADSHAAPSVYAGDARVVANKIDPRAGVDVTSHGDELLVRFARARQGYVDSRIDALALTPRADDVEEGRLDHSKMEPRKPARVVLDDGHFVVVWTRGNPESSDEVVAQSFDANGTPRGAPVVVSPPEIDVMGSPHAVTTDGRHVVVTFAASNGQSFDALAVGVDDARVGRPDAAHLAQR
jgi:hypothetical protein